MRVTFELSDRDLCHFKRVMPMARGNGRGRNEQESRNRAADLAQFVSGVVLPDVVGQAANVDEVTLAYHEGPLDDVLQLADVPGEGVVHQERQGVVLDALYVATLGGAKAPDKVLDQERDILGALPEGKEPDLHHIQPEVEVLAELSLLDHLR